MTDKEISGFSVRITQGSRTALTAITMEIARTYLKDAIAAIDESIADDKDTDECAARYVKAVRCASRCVDNLITSLDLTQSISGELLVIYQYMKNNLRQLKRKPDKDMLLVLSRMIDRLGKAFDEVAGQDKSGPMMANTQKVYAGLTYGQGTLNETCDNSNRGFFA